MEYIDRGEAIYWQQEAHNASNYASTCLNRDSAIIWQIEAAYCYRMARNALGMPI